MNKKCSKCCTIFPSSDNFFYKDRHSRDGLTSSCRHCKREASARSYNKSVNRKPSLDDSRLLNSNLEAMRAAYVAFNSSGEYVINLVLEGNTDKLKTNQMRFYDGPENLPLVTIETPSGTYTRRLSDNTAESLAKFISGFQLRAFKQ